MHVAFDQRDPDDTVIDATCRLSEQVAVGLQRYDVPDSGGIVREVQAVAGSHFEHGSRQAGQEGLAVLTHAAILKTP